MQAIEQDYCNVLIRKLLRVSGLTGLSSGGAQLYTTAHPNLLSSPIFRIVANSSVYDYNYGYVHLKL
jgi:hypothetical protein